jgi:predicted ATPase
MQLVSLKVEKLHGFLDIAIDFHDDLTVIVGVNGSGKTSALRLLAAMMRLDTKAIKTFAFEVASLKARNSAGKEVHLYATTASGPHQIALVMDDVEHNLSYFELAAGSIKHGLISSTHTKHFTWLPEATFDFSATSPINLEYVSFPTPDAVVAAKGFLRETKLAFVQLDRTIVAVNPSGSEASETATRVFGLESEKATDAIDEVVRVTKKAFLDYKRVSETIKDRAYRSSLKLHFEPIKGPLVNNSNMLADLSAMRARVSHSPLTADDSEINTLATVFFDGFEALVKESQLQKSKKQPGRRTLDEEQLDAILALKRWQIESLLAVFEQEDRNMRDAYASIGKYLASVDRFFRESGKRISFDSDYELAFEFGNASQGATLTKGKSLKELSSGERQILIILTYLAFVSGPNSVFIIDEPELSLHLVWQRVLIDALSELRPASCQIVLATHAPEIVGRAREKAVRLGSKSIS